VPALEGKRVQVHFEIIEDPELQLPADQQRERWASWVKDGPQGPLDDHDDWP
jgi:hypothetical protein